MQYWQALGYAPPDEMIEIAKVAEEAGFEGLLLSDHIFVPEDRKALGLMMQMSVRENGMLSGLVREAARSFFIHAQANAIVL